MTCPNCGGTLRHVEHYESRCHETGYVDSGDRYSCRGCGAILDDSEIEEEACQATQ